MSAALQTGVNIDELALLGVGDMIVVMILGILAQIGLSCLVQGNLKPTVDWRSGHRLWEQPAPHMRRARNHPP